MAVDHRRAWAIALALLAIVTVLIFLYGAESGGHAEGSTLIPDFKVSIDQPAGLPPAQTTLVNESYRYGVYAARQVTFRAEVGHILRTYRKPAILVTDAFAFITVSLNGVVLSDQGARDGPLPDRKMEPRIYYLEPGRVEGPATLEIKLSADGTAPFLYEVFVAEQAPATSAYRARRFVAIEGVVAATAIAIFAGLLTLAVAPMLEAKALAVTFALVMLLWAARNFTYVGPTFDLPAAFLGIFYFLTTFMILFATLHLINIWTFNSAFIRRYFSIGLLAVLVCLFVPVMLGIPGSANWARLIGNFVGASCFLFMFGQLVFALIVRTDPNWFETFLFLLCLSVGVIELAGDALPELTRWALPSTGLSMAYGPLMPLPLAAGMLVNFARRTFAVQTQLRRSNATLALELEAREREIARVYAEREGHVRESALMVERQRIMQDMHDGIGSQLLGLLLRSKAGKLAIEDVTLGLQQSLDDLHLVVGSLDQSSDSLEQALGEFRARIEPKCEAAGVALDWQVDEIGPAKGLGPAKVLQIYRILQEACSNAIRHGNPSLITIRAARDPKRGDWVRIVVEDNGTGFDAAAKSAYGRGLLNMNRRAATIGAVLAIESRPSCTRISLTVETA